MERYERKNKQEINKWTPRSRSKWFPSLRGEVDWWKHRSRFQLSQLLYKNKSAPYTICHVRAYDLISGGDFSSLVSVSHMEDQLVAQNLG
jgi:hypothetical protein